jgi:hypothetical protein
MVPPPDAAIPRPLPVATFSDNMRPDRMAPKLPVLLVLLLLAASASGCPEATDRQLYAFATADDDDATADDDDSGGDDDDSFEPCDLEWIVATDETVSLSGDLEPLFFSHCSTCHTTANLGNLLLLPGQAWGNLVDVPNLLGYDGGMARVEPGDPQDSYLIRKIARCDMNDPDWGYWQGPMPPPLPKQPMLDGDQAGLIWSWVEQGAPDN